MHPKLALKIDLQRVARKQKIFISACQARNNHFAYRGYPPTPPADAQLDMAGRECYIFYTQSIKNLYIKGQTVCFKK